MPPPPTDSLAGRFIVAFNARDAQAMAELATPDVVVYPLRALVEDVVYRGVDGLHQWVADIEEAWSKISIELEDVEVHPAGVEFVRGHIVGSGHRSTAVTEATGYWVGWTRDGRIRKLVTFTDRSAAEAAFAEAISEPEAIAAGLNAFQSIATSDMSAWRALGQQLWTEDIEMVEDPRWPGAGEFHGVDEVAGRFYEYFQSLEHASADLVGVHGSGEVVVLELVLHARGRESGVPVDQRWGWLMRRRGGRIASIRPYIDVAEALAAAGLPPS